MTRTWRAVVTLAILTTGCEAGRRPDPIVIAGPTVPSPLPTVEPYIWDTRDELAVWVNNPVARGTLALEGSGPDAFVRIERADREWVMRGPDLVPAVAGVRTLRVRYRWQLDPSLSPTASKTVHVTAYFQTTTPLHPAFPVEQGAAHAVLQPSADWTDIAFDPGQFTARIEINYCYLRSTGANRGVLEIDRIELVP